MRFRSFLFASAASLAAVLPMAAQAAPQDFYLRLDTGASFSTNAGKDFDTDVGNSPIVGAGVGMKVLPFLRTDVTLSYRPSFEASGTDSSLGTTLTGKADVNSLVGMVNAYYDFPALAGFTPYVGGGIGFARNEIGTTTVSGPGGTVATLSGDTTTSFAWQVGAGVAYTLFSGVALDVGYRYLDAGEVKTGTSATAFGVPFTTSAQRGDIKAHEIQIGVRIGF